MNYFLLTAAILTFLAFILHTFMGDRELKLIEPNQELENHLKQEKWTMARCGWHWVSVDLFLAFVGLTMIVFTDYFEQERVLLQVLSLYFFCYGVVWLMGILISKSFPNHFIKLGQWLLLFVISGLIYWGIG